MSYTKANTVGATIKKLDCNELPIFASVNSSLTLRLQRDQTIGITLNDCVKFDMSSVYLDTEQFGCHDQVRLMIRSNISREWSCLYSYHGNKQKLVSVAQLKFHASGSCAFELCLRGTHENHYVNIACSVLSTPYKFDGHLNIREEGSPILPLNRACADTHLPRVRREFAGLLRHLLFSVCLLLSAIQQAYGELTTSITPLYSTSRLTSHEDKRLSGYNEYSKMSQQASNNLLSQIQIKQLTTGDQAESSAAQLDPSSTENLSVAANNGSRESDSTSNVFDDQDDASTTPNSCIDVVVTFLAPFIDEEKPVEWSLSSIEGTIARKEYSTATLFNTIVTDYITDDGLCLLPGTYTFNITAAGEAYYLVYSGGEVVTCGGILVDGYAVDISLPFDSANVDSECSTLVSCQDDNIDSCLEHAFIPLQCYHSGTEIDVTAAGYNSDGNRTIWFSDTCSIVLEELCQSGALGFGIGNYESEHIKERSTGFCPYFECARETFQDYMANGGSLNEYYGCECKYTQWACTRSGGKCDYKQCCEDNGLVVSGATDIDGALSTSCICRIEPDCDTGNSQMCDVALDYCCDTYQNEIDRNTCTNKYSKIKCQSSVAQSVESDVSVDYSYCEQNAEASCNGDLDEAGCQCEYWESLCAQYPREDICEKAVDFCCPGSALYMSFCYCDFYSWASLLGYQSDLAAGWCSTSETYLNQISNIANDNFGLRMFYQQLGGDFWLDNTGWMSTTPHCEWFGVECSEDRVVLIDLNSNNLTGSVSFFGEIPDDGTDSGSLFKLQELDISNNKLEGVINNRAFFRHRTLQRIDISNNRLKGVVDVLISPSIRLANFSSNRFTSLSHMVKSRKSYNSIETIDLSHNFISQDTSEFFDTLPPNIKGIAIRDNSLAGSFPMDLPSLMNIEVFDVSDNIIMGTIPDFSRSMPRVRKLYLARQKSKGSAGGLSGSIPQTISSLLDLIDLDLSSNLLTSTIVSSLGNIPRLQLLNLSSNALTGEIDKELGKLSDVSIVFDLSNNNLEGSIPEKMKDFVEGAILLGGNDKLLGVAPLGLCYDSTDFDLKDDPKYCPPERNALKDFFDSAKGREWTTSYGWGDQFTDFCSWFGVTCSNETNLPIRLDLGTNGLSGTFSTSFGTLRSLESIDLSDNDIKGSIPAAISDFTELKMLRLSYNQFTSSVPSQLLELQNLELAHFQSNRLTGEISLNSQLMIDASSFISDCGVPTDFEDPLVCTNCSMCCNVQGGCHTTNEPLVNALTFLEFLYIVLGSVTGLLIAGAMFKSIVYNNYCKSEERKRYQVSQEKIMMDKESAFETIGKDSVYCFFLTKSWFGWIFAILVMYFQFYVFLFFVKAAEKDFSDDKSDFTYAWRCPRNSIDCNFLADQTPIGWFTFGVLMLSHIGKDLVQGIKLIYMSTKEYHHRTRRLRFFISGALMILITITAVYSSIVYNFAIARSNAELVENAVIVLYLVDVDEQLYTLMEVMCPKTLERITQGNDDELDTSEDESPGDTEKNRSKDKFEDNENGTQKNMHQSNEITDLYRLVHQLKLELSEVNNNSGSMSINGINNNDAIYRAQISSEQSINDLRDQLAIMERKTEEQFANLRLALQVHKSSTELISDSIRFLHEKTSGMDDEFSDNSPRIL